MVLAATARNKKAESQKIVLGSVTVELVDMSPALSMELMRTSKDALMKGKACVRQRFVKQDKVKSYAKQMVTGQWMLTHQGIAIDVRGVVVDGQHRLSAIIEAGVTVPILVFRGLASEIFAVIDEVNRSLTDMIVMMSQGVNAPAANRLGAVAANMLPGQGNSRNSSRRRQVAMHAVEHLQTILTIDRALGTLDGRSTPASITAAFCNAVISYKNLTSVETLANDWRMEDKDPETAMRRLKAHIRRLRNQDKVTPSRSYYRLVCHVLKAVMEDRPVGKIVEDLDDFQGVG